MTRGGRVPDQANQKRRETMVAEAARLGIELLGDLAPEAVAARGMGRLGTAAGVDRVYYFELYHDPATGQRLGNQRFEWVAPGIEPQIDNPDLQALALDTFFPSMMVDLERGQIAGGSVSELPDAERSILDPQGIQSILLVPMLLEGRLHGVLGFDAVRSLRDWTPVESSVLMIVAAALGVSLQRQRVEHLVRHDPLTRLPNRGYLYERLCHEIDRGRAQQGRVTTIFINIDRFKSLNDSLGHPVGDRALQEISQRLRREVGQDELLARVGGDEFVLASSSRVDPAEVAELAQRFIDAIGEPMVIDDREVYVGASVGIACFPADADDAQSLMRNAGIAMSRAKAAGRGQSCFYSGRMNDHAVAALELDTRIRKALAQGRMHLAYQPQVSLRTGEVVGAEALLRVHDEHDTLIPTATVIAHAEATGSILRLGQWVVGEACRQMAEWSRQGRYSLGVSVNVSARQFFSGDLLDNVATALAEHGVAPARLEIELTETVLMDDPAHAAEILLELSALGVRLALDDFGSGYSSLSYLMRFPIDRLKVDGDFVADLPGNTRAGSIAAAIIDLAHRLDLDVVAEGVETGEQLEFLRDLGCDEMQGYLFSRPVVAEEFPRLLGKSLPVFDPA